MIAQNTAPTIAGRAQMKVTVNVLRALQMEELLRDQPVNSKAAQTRREEDKQRIDGFIEEKVEGGFVGMDGGLLEVSERLVEHQATRPTPRESGLCRAVAEAYGIAQKAGNAPLARFTFSARGLLAERRK